MTEEQHVQQAGILTSFMSSIDKLQTIFSLATYIAQIMCQTPVQRNRRLGPPFILIPKALEYPVGICIKLFYFKWILCFIIAEIKKEENTPKQFTNIPRNKFSEFFLLMLN